MSSCRGLVRHHIYPEQQMSLSQSTQRVCSSTITACMFCQSLCMWINLSRLHFLKKKNHCLGSTLPFLLPCAAVANITVNQWIAVSTYPAPNRTIFPSGTTKNVSFVNLGLYRFNAGDASINFFACW